MSRFRLLPRLVVDRRLAIVLLALATTLLPVALVVGWTMAHFGIQHVFAIFAASLLVVAIITAFCAIETKHRFRDVTKRQQERGKL